MRVLVSAGSTYEFIDPVRIFISNNSTGKMGLEIMKALKAKNCYVKGIIGKSQVSFDQFDCEYVNSSDSMLSSIKALMPEFDIFISTAAISDYKLKKIHTNKIKSKVITLELEKGTDILQCIYSEFQRSKLIVGFALETSNIIQNAKEKLKKAHIIVANHSSHIANDSGSLYVLVPSKNNPDKENIFIHKLENLSKSQSAKKLVSIILNNFNKL